MTKNKGYHKQEGSNTSSIKIILKKTLVFTILLCIVAFNPATTKVSNADSTNMVNVSVNFVDEVAYVTAGTGLSTKFYISTDNKKTWELLDSSTVDISTLLTTREKIIYFKGNKETNPAPLILPAENKTLTVAYKVASGEGRIEFTSAQTVEYRKGANGAWKTATSPMPTALYELKGATLNFRTVATTAVRAGKIVSVRVPKRPTAPSVKLDGSKLCITGMKTGETQYRVGDNLVWTTFTPLDKNTRTIDLSALLGGSTVTNTQIPAGTIELRTVGTDKKVNSASKVIEVPMQSVMLGTTASVSGSSLSILDTNTKTAYEYTIVANGKVVDLSTAKWTTVTSAKMVIIPKVAINDMVLVRLKSKTDSTTKQIIPASTYYPYTITSITPK